MYKCFFKAQLLLVILFGLTFTSCSSVEETKDSVFIESDSGKESTTFVAGGEAKTRTSLDYNSSDFFWEAGDYIYVKDDNGILQKSSNAPTSKVAIFEYQVTGSFKSSDSYKVYYLGKNSNNYQAVISTSQGQTKPNTTEHFGEVGDYGTAMANKIAEKYHFSFALDHKPAYLVFQPYVSNTKLVSTYVTKIEVVSDNDIAETYTIDPSTDGFTSSAGSKQIELSTIGSGDYSNGFPLNNQTPSVSTNGAYMIIKPGTHTLTVRYYVKDIMTNVEGVITKSLPSFDYVANNYYDMTAKLDVEVYDGDHYYMWDAKDSYWKGHEWWSEKHHQPVLRGNKDSNYPLDNSDSRYFSENFYGYYISIPATQESFRKAPNANEMSWYCMYGDAHWEEETLWATMGHLHKGGIWLKKKAVLIAENHYDTEKSADGKTDLRLADKTYAYKPVIGLPSAENIGDYFFLPASGNYKDGMLYHIDVCGYCWSSTGHPFSAGPGAYGLQYLEKGIFVSNYYRYLAYRVSEFK